MHLDILYLLYFTRLILAIILTAVFVANTVALLISLIVKSDFRVYSSVYGIASNHTDNREHWTRVVYNLRNMSVFHTAARILVSVLYLAGFFYIAF